MVIRLLLATDDSAAVSTSITVNTADPSWPAWLVEAITYHAQQSARRLRDDLIAQFAWKDKASPVDQRPPAIAGMTMMSLPSGTTAPLPPRARASSSPM